MLNLFFLVFSLVLLYFALTGAPYLPTAQTAVEEMVRLADVTPGTRVADIGSGDGRIVIAFAKAGAEAHGYEINPLLVWISRRKIRSAGLETRGFIHFKSFWGADLSAHGVVTIFGIKNIMARFEKKLLRELKPGSRVLSYIYQFPTLKETREAGSVHLYAIGDES